MTVDAPKPSDLGIRTLSAIVMVAVAGVALWLGGWVFTACVVAVGLGVIWEWWGLASKIAKTPLGAALWLAAGVSYVGVAMAELIGMRVHSGEATTSNFHHLLPLLYTVELILAVVFVDIFAYFFGRSIGGPKIAPKISPSKTWAGLVGGTLGAAVAMGAGFVFIDWFSIQYVPAYSTIWRSWPSLVGDSLLVGTVIAIVAQAGDFFESWMKRRAGMKDSGNLIPGHGGLFDRVDGLLAVLFVTAIFMWAFKGSLG